MKIRLFLVIPAMLLAAAARNPILGGSNAMPQAAPPAQNSDPGDSSPIIADALIEPGLRVGPLKIGDTRERALELFPKKAEDQEWDDPCGTTLDWVDASNPAGRGDLSIRLKKERVFQIESSTTRFQTAEGITTFDSPEKIERAYKNMSAYVLLTNPQPSLGDRPLVFWVDRKKGIAFSLAYDPSRHKRYLYKIIVFAPRKEFCPEQEKTDSPKWQSIRPYAVEPPIELSPEMSGN
jgi:hypothetical protein